MPSDDASRYDASRYDASRYHASLSHASLSHASLSTLFPLHNIMQYYATAWHDIIMPRLVSGDDGRVVGLSLHLALGLF